MAILRLGRPYVRLSGKPGEYFSSECPIMFTPPESHRRKRKNCSPIEHGVSRADRACQAIVRHLAILLVVLCSAGVLVATTQ